MNVFARSLMVVAIASYTGLALSGADAKPGGPAGTAGASAGHGVNGTNGVSGVAGKNSVSGVNSQDGIGGQHGYGISQGKSDPAPSPSSNYGGGEYNGPPVYNLPPVFNLPPVYDNQSGFTALAGSSGACGTAPELPDTSWYTNKIDGIEVISQQTQNYLQSCGCNTQACVADALDNYANALEKAVEPAPPVPGQPSIDTRKLPRAIRDLPRVVHEAAARVRAAPTKVAAQKAVQAAIEIVQKTAAKTIALMRADDPDAKQAITRGTDLVADTLKSAQTELLRPETL